MKIFVRRWGNSLAVRIPKVIAAETGLREGSVVELGLVDRKIVLVPVRVHQYRLEDLLAGISEENLHSEFSTGAPVGNESW